MSKDPEHDLKNDLLEPFRAKDSADLTEMALNYKASQLVEAFNGRIPSRREIEDITKNLGVELATAVFLRSVIAAPVQGQFQKRIRDILIEGASAKPSQPTEILFTNSNLYQSGRQWGDHVDEWRAWARDIGFQTDVVDTQKGSSVASNARWMRDWLSMNPHPRRILVTYGQGTSEMRYMLQRSQNRPDGSRPSELLGLIGWVSVAGSFAGSSSSDELSRSIFTRLKTEMEMKWNGRNHLCLSETATKFSFWKTPLRVPKNLVVASVFGVPYRAQIPQGLHSLYNALAKRGPNDGVVNVYESMIPSGFYLPVSGMSHRAESLKLKPHFIRLLLGLSEGVGASSENLTRSQKPANKLTLDLSQS